MRAGSTLLLHLLATSRQIISAGERSVPVATNRDLHKLAVQAYRMNRSLRPRRYVVEQLNHNHLMPADDLLHRPNVRTIILVREPVGTIASMMDVLGRYYDFDRERAQSYYAERLPDLSRLAGSIAEAAVTPALFLTYDQLVENTAESLFALGNYLGLDDPLSEEYSLQPFTGHRGDPSATIHSGRVVPPPERDSATDTTGMSNLYATQLDELAASCLGISDVEPTGNPRSTPGKRR